MYWYLIIKNKRWFVLRNIEKECLIWLNHPFPYPSVHHIKTKTRHLRKVKIIFPLYISCLMTWMIWPPSWYLIHEIFLWNFDGWSFSYSRLNPSIFTPTLSYCGTNSFPRSRHTPGYLTQLRYISSAQQYNLIISHTSNCIPQNGRWGVCKKIPMVKTHVSEKKSRFSFFLGFSSFFKIFKPQIFLRPLFSIL